MHNMDENLSKTYRFSFDVTKDNLDLVPSKNEEFVRLVFDNSNKRISIQKKVLTC